MKILVFDPSGNYFEGKGTSGWALYYSKKLTSVGQIRAVEYKNQFEYWKNHIDLIQAMNPTVVVIESYLLFASTKEAQIGSEFETPQLIGLIKYFCEEHSIHIRLQNAHIKHRYSNDLLLKKEIISQDKQQRYYAVGVPITKHIIDAIRHGEYYINFKLKKERFYESTT